MAGVTLENVTKSFGRTKVIHGVDLEIADQEFVVFVGPSGCGKSTLLRMISGLEGCDSGAIRIGDKDVTGLEPSERGISMVFQSYALYPHMTVEQNMSFGLRAQGMAKEEVARRVAAATQILHLEEFLKRRPSALSGGQRQRVAIGRAIVRHPDVFLFDEPLSNLDAELRVHMRFEIERLHKRLDATMIYVTHDQVEAMTLADRIVVLRSGRVEQVGTPLQLFDDPDNQFVAGFIGAPKMNFLPGIVAEETDESVGVELPSVGGVRLTMAISDAGLKPGQAVTVGIRPEHLSFQTVPGAKLDLTCELVEQLGDVAYLYANSAQDQQVVIGLRDDRTKTEKQALQVFVPSERAFLFDTDGKRIR